MLNCEQLLADLRRRSTAIAPLKLRRTNPNRATTVESLCDWETDEVKLNHLSDTETCTRQTLLRHSFCFCAGVFVKRREVNSAVSLEQRKLERCLQ